LLRPRRERPSSRRRAAEERDELPPFHQRFLPCFEAEDSTAGDLLHCGISKEPLSALGLGRVKTPASAARIEASRKKLAYQSGIMLRTDGSTPCWRILFSTLRRCMSFHTARVKTRSASLSSHSRFLRVRTCRCIGSRPSRAIRDLAHRSK
jgi:hypothetical protein